MSSEGDRLLVQQIRQGDARAWDGLIARYEGRLLAFVDRRLHDRAASEDVVQETFVGFLNSLPNFDETRELQTYLFTIASHKVTDHLRRSGRHPLHPASEGAGDVLQNQYDHHPAASSLARSQERKELESEAVAHSLRQLIQQAVKEPKRRRKTKPSKGARERRLQSKKRRSEIKSHRRGSFE